MGSKVMAMSTFWGTLQTSVQSIRSSDPPTPGPVTSREQGLLDIGDQTSQEYLQEALKEREKMPGSVSPP